MQTKELEFIIQSRKIYSEELILKSKELFDKQTWENLIITNKLTGDFIFKNNLHLLDNVYFYDLSYYRCCKFTEEQIVYLLENEKAYSGKELFTYMQFTEDFIEKYSSSNFRTIAGYQKLLEKFIREHQCNLSDINIYILILYLKIYCLYL